MMLRPREQCWSCKAQVPNRYTVCPDCGAPSKGEQVDRLRYLVFLCFEIKKHEKVGRIPLSVTHGLMAECNERIAALRGKLEQERAPMVQPASETEQAPAPEPQEPAQQLPAYPEPGSGRPTSRPRKKREEPARREPVAESRTLLEILLDPRSIQWLLASGGALMVLGLIFWLLAQKLLEEKEAVAVLLGVGTGLLLVLGWFLILGTRYHLTGRALTLLACLVMPFNLWFYAHEDLIPLKEGGHLWIPALICCALYAISARLLKDLLFVPVLVLGVAGTGLLLLADQPNELAQEIAAPTIWLVALGIACIHLERAFPEGDSPFSRKRFGLAFFWSGQAVLAAGLGLLLGAQVFGGWLYDPFFKPFFRKQPEIVLTTWGQMLALGLVLGPVTLTSTPTWWFAVSECICTWPYSPCSGPRCC